MRLYLFVIALALPIVPTTAQELPRIVKSAIAENNSESCKKTTVEPGFLTRQDINADGRPDYILDYGSLRCDGQRAFCGSLGCEFQVFASLPNGTYAKVVDDVVRGGISFRQVKGRPAVVLEFRGDADPCRGDPTTRFAKLSKPWNGSTFASTPATRAAKTAAAASPPASACSRSWPRVARLPPRKPSSFMARASSLSLVRTTRADGYPGRGR